jgi:hypothetical protein
MLRLSSTKDVPDGYKDLIKKCCAYKAKQRPLIDLVRVALQDMMERAAEIDLTVMSSGNAVDRSSSGVVGNVDIEMTDLSVGESKIEV